MMGARTFLNQLAVDTVQHRTHRFTDEIDVSTLKDYMKVTIDNPIGCHSSKFVVVADSVFTFVA